MELVHLLIVGLKHLVVDKMFEFREITHVDQIRSEMEPLLRQHYAELTLDQDIIKLEPIWESYQKLFEQDQLFALGVYYLGGLIGYSVFFLRRHIHYANNTIADNDVLFLAKSSRQGRLGIELIRESERRLAARGVSKITWHVKKSRDFRPILTRLGYVEEDIIMGRALRGEK